MDWIPTTFGLLGVIVGGLITAASSYYLDLRRERASKERDNLNYAIEIKRAARLIELELKVARANVEAVIEQRTWTPGIEPKTEAWQKYRSVIAPVLSSDDWATLTEAVVAIEGVGLVGLTGGDISQPVLESLFLPTPGYIDEGLIAIAPLALDVAPAPLKVSLWRWVFSRLHKK